MQPFERLEAWKMSHQLALAVYRVTDSFPRHELYGLTSQARRAAFSVPANLVEGSAKRGPAEFRRFLDISLGSLAELAYVLIFVRDRGLISPEAWRELETLRKRSAFLVWRLYDSMRRAMKRQSGGS
jgi:four helix bundle protein